LALHQALAFFSDTWRVRGRGGGGRGRKTQTGERTQQALDLVQLDARRRRRLAHMNAPATPHLPPALTSTKTHTHTHLVAHTHSVLPPYFHRPPQASPPTCHLPCLDAHPPRPAVPFNDQIAACNAGCAMQQCAIRNDSNCGCRMLLMLPTAATRGLWQLPEPPAAQRCGIRLTLTCLLFPSASSILLPSTTKGKFSGSRGCA
jgi:hypothetical protein